MKKELKYFFAIVSIFTISTYILAALLKKYSSLTFEHFFEVCRESASTFFSSGVHYAGFILTTLAVFGLIAFFTKSLFSYLKTKKKLALVLEKETPGSPKILTKIQTKYVLLRNKVTVVDIKSDVAITIGWLNPKIIVSTSLVAKLTEKELEAVLLHEYYHLKRKHPLLLIISEILSSSLFFMPIIADLTKNLRTVLESEADRFVIKNQREHTHLNLALAKVTAENKFSLYPTFSKRNDYKLKKSSFIISTIVLMVGVVLFLLPTQSHASADVADFNSGSCGNYQCSTHCDGENMSKNETMTPVYQTVLTSFSYRR